MSARSRSAEDWRDDRDLSSESNNPPNHGAPTHSTARFLWVVPKDTPISELGEKYDAWKRRQESEQSELEQWGDGE